MGIMSRMSTVVKSKMNRLLDRAEDPSETLDYAYEKQREMLQNVKRGIVEMVTTKRRLQLQAEKVRASVSTVENQARQAMAAGREDLARLALQRKQTALIELEGLDQQIEQLEMEQEKLTNAERRLVAKVEAFRSRKEIVKAQYNAAQAQVRIGSALSGISEEMGDVATRRRARGEQDREPASQGERDRRARRIRRAGRPDVARRQRPAQPRTGAANRLAERRGRTGSAPAERPGGTVRPQAADSFAGRRGRTGGAPSLPLSPTARTDRRLVRR